MVFVTIFCLINTSYAQDVLELKGVVVDASTKEPIAFANLGILDTKMGVASDINGVFKLKISSNFDNMIIKATAVGYKSFEISIAEAAKQEYITISLDPVSYKIEEVNVLGKIQVYRRMIKDVVKDIPTNYISKSSNYKAYLENNINVKGKSLINNRAYVMLYDSKGYNREDVLTDFNSICYKVYNPVSLSKDAQNRGMVYLDDLLSYDLVRNTRNVLDIDNIDSYKLSDLGKLFYDDHKVQIIGFELSKPSLSLTGDVYATKYYGKLYVDLTDNVIIRAIVTFEGGYNPEGRNLYTSDDNVLKDVKRTVKVDYKKLDDKYFLSAISVKYNGESINGKSVYITRKINRTSPEKIVGREYFNDDFRDVDFQYSTYFEGED